MKINRRGLATACVVMLLTAGSGNLRSAVATDLVRDLSVSVESLPATVSPGAFLFYRLTVKNLSPVGTKELQDVTVTNELPPGFSYEGFRTDITCSGSGTSATCEPFGLAPAGSDGDSKVIDIVAKSDTTDGQFINTATVSSSTPLDLDPSNNTSQTTTTVEGGGTKGYFPPGNYKVGNHVLTVPEQVDDSTPGVFGDLEVLGATSSFCQTKDNGGCKYGEAVRADFDPVPEFQVTNRDNPLKLTLNYTKIDPCRGLGSGSGCATLKAKKADGTIIDPVPECLGEPGKIGDSPAPPCVDQMTRLVPAGYRFLVLLLSEDPTFY